MASAVEILSGEQSGVPLCLRNWPYSSMANALLSCAALAGSGAAVVGISAAHAATSGIREVMSSDMSGFMHISLGLLLFLNESPARKVGIGVRFDLVIFQATDGAINFKHGQSHIAALGDTVLAHGTVQFVHADVLSRHVRLHDLSIVNEKAGLALNHAPKGAIGAGKPAYQVIQ